MKKFFKVTVISIIIISYIIFHPQVDYSYDFNFPEEFGNQEDFWTFRVETEEYIQVHSTLLAEGDHCYIYMDNHSIATLGEEEAIKRSEIHRDEFESTIFSTNCDLMGDPKGKLGDIDGDPHITVLLIEDGGAYYNVNNEIAERLFSNNREMMYICYCDDNYCSFGEMCHETNHLFMFNYDLNEAVFIYEGIAEFSKYCAGYLSNSSYLQGEMKINATMSSTYFSKTPSASMLYFDTEYASNASYGAAYLFVFYLAEKYGVHMISDLIPVDYDGPEAIDYILSEHEQKITFNDLYMDFITACTIDELGIYDNRYGFVNTDFKIDEKFQVNSYPYNRQDVEQRNYGIEIHQLISPPNEITLKIESPADPYSLGVSIAIDDDNGWNVTQTVISGSGDFVYLHINGENIDTAYIITSVIRKGITNAPRRWMESPINELDYYFLEGFIAPTTPPQSTDETVISFLAPLISICILVNLLKKKKKSLSSN